MFLIKAGTVIQVEIKGPRTLFYWHAWRPYTTKEDKIYDKHEVWDAVAVLNGRPDIPHWAIRNIKEHNKTVICRNGKYALVNPKDITYLD